MDSGNVHCHQISRGTIVVVDETTGIVVSLDKAKHIAVIEVSDGRRVCLDFMKLRTP